MNDHLVAPSFARFVAMATARLAEDSGYGPVPEPGGQQEQRHALRIFGRTRTVGMALNVNLVALVDADGLSPADMESRLETLTAMVRRIGEQGNVEAQRGGQGRHVTALLLWVFVNPLSAEVAGARRPCSARCEAAARSLAVIAPSSRWPMAGTSRPADRRRRAPTPSPPRPSGDRPVPGLADPGTRPRRATSRRPWSDNSGATIWRTC